MDIEDARKALCIWLDRPKNPNAHKVGPLDMNLVIKSFDGCAFFLAPDVGEEELYGPKYWHVDEVRAVIAHEYRELLPACPICTKRFQEGEVMTTFYLSDGRIVIHSSCRDRLEQAGLTVNAANSIGPITGP